MNFSLRNISLPIVAVIVLVAMTSPVTSESKMVADFTPSSSNVASPVLAQVPAVPAKALTKKPETKQKDPAWETSDADDSDFDSDATDADSARREPPAIGALFPIGRKFRGVKIPSYSGDILNSVVTADTMVRVDDEHMEMNALVITLFGDADGDDTIITTQRGVYDLKSESLTSRSKAYITREGQFDMVGDRMIFNGATQEGRLIGNVQMKINIETYKVSESLENP